MGQSNAHIALHNVASYSEKQFNGKSDDDINSEDEAVVISLNKTNIEEIMQKGAQSLDDIAVPSLPLIENDSETDSDDDKLYMSYHANDDDMHITVEGGPLDVPRQDNKYKLSASELENAMTIGAGGPKISYAAHNEEGDNEDIKTIGVAL